MDGHQRQKELSRQMIENALFALMKEKDYARITISEITARADVARRTFYRLYEHKEDIIMTYLDRLCQQYQEQQAVLTGYDICQIAQDFFAFWYQYRELLLLLYAQKLDYLMYAKISRASVNVVRNRICDSKLKLDSDLEYFADYSTGGFLNLLCRWIKSGMEEPPEQYAENVSRAVLKYFQSGTGHFHFGTGQF